MHIKWFVFFLSSVSLLFFFFFQAEDGIRDRTVTGVQTCPLPILKQVHPGWDGLQIKAAIMNTADQTLNTGYNVRRAGTGVVQAQKATHSSVLATTADELDSLAFGYVPGSGAYSAQKAIKLTNYGSSSVTYNLGVAAQSS